MSQYESIPRVVDAVLWDGTNDAEVQELVAGIEPVLSSSLGLDYFVRFQDATVRNSTRRMHLWIEKSKVYAYDLLPGTAVIQEDDQIGVYPCDHDAFINNYRPVS